MGHLGWMINPDGNKFTEQPLARLIGAVTCRDELSCLIRFSKSCTRLVTGTNLLTVILFLRSMCQRLFKLCVTVFSWISRDASLVTLKASKEACCFCVRAVETLLSNLVSAESKVSTTKIINNIIFRGFL